MARGLTPREWLRDALQSLIIRYMEYRGSRCLQGLLSACLSLVLVGLLWLVTIELSLATHAEASQAGKGYFVPAARKPEAALAVTPRSSPVSAKRSAEAVLSRSKKSLPASCSVASLARTLY